MLSIVAGVIVRAVASVSRQDDDDEAGEDDDDDDGFFVPHGYLSDGEGALEEEVRKPCPFTLRSEEFWTWRRRFTLESRSAELNPRCPPVSCRPRAIACVLENDVFLLCCYH